MKGMKPGQAERCVQAMRALYGPPHTPESLAEYNRLRAEEMARAEQRRRGEPDLFEQEPATE